MGGSGYGQSIPRDMGCCAGLARRHDRLLIPWMQAHTYGGAGGLQDVTPEQVDRMAAEQLRHGPDAIIWLGYGFTFPKVKPESWARAGEFHKRLGASRPAKPKAQLAVLRPYTTWALSSRWQDKVRNPADWMLQQFLEVWAVKHGKPYDVFEIPPGQTPADREMMDKADLSDGSATSQVVQDVRGNLRNLQDVLDGLQRGQRIKPRTW